MDPPAGYLTELTRVREVLLRGSADLAYWRDRLRPEGLTPAVRDGRAQVLVVGAAMKYLGLRFAEISFSVLVEPPGQVGREAAFLVRAFNSSRLFGFCERTLFKTPYTRVACRVSTAPVSLRVGPGGGEVFRAERGAGGEPGREETDAWEGPIFLPTRPGRRPERVFFARLRGDARVYPFRKDRDALSIRPSRRATDLHALVDSDFVACEWVVRAAAIHARSKTYRMPRQGTEM